MDASCKHHQFGGALAPEAVAPLLLGWYDAHARALPWRAMPGAAPPPPYHVWLSEVMLQQTTVQTVSPRFARFIARWPTIAALASADDGDIMAEWAGLGYYARARNLIACARVIASSGGQFPKTEAELRQLPGIGDYTAAAIAAIAFNQRAVVIDANIERVVARLFAISVPQPRARPIIREAAGAITPDARCGDFAQAMMDLGAMVCRPRDPQCGVCPLAGVCVANAMGAAERFPVKPPKKPRPSRTGRAFWIEQDGCVWLIRRDKRGILGGMRALPDDGWNSRRDGASSAPFAGNWVEAGAVSHTFTHFSLVMKVMIHSGRRVNPAIMDNSEWQGEWWPVEQIAQAGLPTLFANAANLAMAQRETDDKHEFGD